MKMLSVERAAGKRADFHLYWKKPNGKLMVDAMWAPSPEEAKRLFLSFAKELRWKVASVVRVEKVS